MDKVAIFGKKGSIAKYDLTNNKPIWVGDLPSGYTPHIMGQYEDYVIVFSWAWFATKMVHCFRESSGELLWSHYQHGLHSEMTPFIPHTLDKHMYYLASQREVSKLSWETGKVLFRKRFKKSIFKSFVEHCLSLLPTSATSTHSYPGIPSYPNSYLPTP